MIRPSIHNVFLIVLLIISFLAQNGHIAIAKNDNADDQTQGNKRAPSAPPAEERRARIQQRWSGGLPKKNKNAETSSDNTILDKDGKTEASTLDPESKKIAEETFARLPEEEHEEYLARMEIAQKLRDRQRAQEAAKNFKKPGMEKEAEL